MGNYTYAFIFFCNHIYSEDKSVVCRVVLSAEGPHRGRGEAGVSARVEGVDQDNPDHVERLEFLVVHYNEEKV